MSTTIDQRVVEMRFDNKQFESATATSMSTIDKLKQKLNFTGATKGLENVSSAAKKIDMSGLGSAVETVHSRFSALEVIGVTALANIANSAVNAGKQIVSALTIDPIITGFQEYETQMNAVQTILANTQSKGTTLDDVTAALDELNQYADQTIYNFTEMTKNIGTFTAAGVDLDKSVTSIKGIANLAAVSGSNAQQASTAMYQLSQALAAGRVSLMDWNSVVNAGMGGELFQNALKRTAEQMGTDVDALITKYGSFRESLTEGAWLTADVLTETLTQLSGAYTEADLIAQGYTDQQAKDIVQLAETAVGAATDVKTFTQLWDTMKEAVQSGWAKTWQIILGDFEQAKAFFTELSNLFGPIIENFSNARNDLLEGALSSNWDKMIKQINEAGIETADFTAELEKTARSVTSNYDKIIEKNGSLSAAFMSGDLKASIIIDTLDRLAGVTGATATETENMAGKLEYFQKVVDDVWYGSYKNGEERIKALTDAGYDYAQVQALVNKTVDGHRLTLEDLTDTQLKSIGYTDEEVTKLRELAEQAKKTGTPLNELINNLTKPSGRELLLESVMNVLKSIINIAGAVGAAWEEIFPSMKASQLYSIIEGINSLTDGLFASVTENTDEITRTFKGLFAILDLITTIVGGGFKAAFEVLSTILSAFDMDILDFTAKLGDAAVGLRDFILDNELVAKGIKNIADGIVAAATAIKDWIDAFLALPSVQTAIDNLGNQLLNLKEIGLDAIEGLQNGLQDGVKSIPDILVRIGTAILEAIKGVLGIHSPSTEMYKVGENTIQGLIDGFLDGASRVLGAVKELGQKIVDTIFGFFEGIDWSTVLAIGISAGLLVLSKKMVDIVSAIVSPLQGIGDLLSGVGEVLEEAAKPIGKVIKGFANVLNSYALSIKADALKSVAIAIGILAASIFVLSRIDVPDLLKAIGALAGLAVIIGVLTAAVGKFGPDSALKFGGFALALVGISSSLLIISAALKVLDSLNPDTAAQTLIAFTTVMLSLMGLLAVFGQLVNGKASANIAKVGTMMLGLSVSLLLITAVIKIMSGMSLEELAKGGAAILAFVGIVTLLTLVTRLAGSGIDKLGSTMIKLSIALGLMVVVVKLISGMPASELIKGGLAITAFVGIIGALALITNLASPIINRLASTLLAMSASMLIMVGVIKIVATMEVGDVIKGVAALTAFTGIVGLLVLITNMASKDAPKMAATLLAMSASIAILAGVAVLLSLIDIGGLAKGIVAIGLLAGVMSLMIIATKDAQDIHGNLIAMSVAIGIMAASIAVLSFIDPSKLTGATLALSLVMGMFAILIESSSNVQTSMGVLIAMTAAIAVIGAIVYALSTLPVESVLSTAGSLSVLLLSLSASMMILNRAGKVTPATLLSLASMELALLGLAGILKWLSDIDPASSIGNATALGILLGALSGVTLILAAVGKIGVGAALQGALALDALILVVGGLMAGIGALAAYFPQLEEFVDKGIGLLEAVGKGIGSFVGGIVGGFLSGVTSGLPDIASDLSNFMLNLTPFITGTKMIDESSISAVKSLAEMILLLTAADVINGIASFFTGGSSLSEFATQLVPFGQAMAKFGQTIKGQIDAESMTAVTNAGMMLAELNKSLPRDGGLLQGFLGSQDLSAFSDQLSAFGEAIVAFSETVAPGGTLKINAEAVEAAANAGKLISDLNNSLPSSGGVLQDFLGSQDLGAFSEDMKAFGEAVVSFSELVAPNGQVLINSGAIEAAVNAGTMLSELSNTLPKNGGFLQSFLGSQDLGVFGEQIKGFGESIVAFSQTIAPEGTPLISSEAVEAAANAGKMMSDLANNLPKQGGFLGALLGDRSMSDFGNDLVLFGESLAAYAKHISGIDPDVVEASANAAKALVKLADGLPEDKLFTNETTLDEFGSQLSKFGGKFADFYSKISGINVTTLTSAISGMEDLINMAKGIVGLDFKSLGSFASNLEKLGKDGIDGFVNAFTNSGSRVSEAATALITTFINSVNTKTGEFTNTFVNLINTVLNAIKSKYYEIQVAGQTLMSKFVDGISSREAAARAVMLNVVASIASSIKSGYSGFYSAGSYLVQGFINGMEAHMDDVRRAARRLAQEAYEAAMDELDEHSPSRRFHKIGEFVAIGFANGITSSEAIAGDSAKEMADTAISTVKSTISKMVDLINDDIDPQPTIRPVLDLSDVQSGTARLNTMFSRTRAMSISTSMAPRSTIQEEPDTGVTSKSGATFQFTQNNYSPKALSRVEIYRQTNNQFSAFERMVRA